jgi:hypothetical protein
MTFRFSLRTAFVAITTVCVLLGTWAWSETAFYIALFWTLLALSEPFWPRSNPRKRFPAFSICRQNYLDVGTLVEGPDRVFLCADCCSALVQKVQQEATPVTCSLCRIESQEFVRGMKSNDEFYICRRCIDHSLELLERHARRGQPRKAE